MINNIAICRHSTGMSFYSSRKSISTWHECGPTEHYVEFAMVLALSTSAAVLDMLVLLSDISGLNQTIALHDMATNAV